MTKHQAVIDASKYQTSNLKAYLDSDIPTDKQKADALNSIVRYC